MIYTKNNDFEVYIVYVHLRKVRKKTSDGREPRTPLRHILETVLHWFREHSDEKIDVPSLTKK